MASLHAEMKKAFREYLDSIHVPYVKRAKLSELMELVKKNNSSAPERAVGVISVIAVNAFEQKQEL